jgi:hypothetical protein
MAEARAMTAAMPAVLAPSQSQLSLQLETREFKIPSADTANTATNGSKKAHADLTASLFVNPSSNVFPSAISLSLV